MAYATIPAEETPLQKPKASSTRKFIVAGAAAAVLVLGAIALPGLVLAGGKTSDGGATDLSSSDQNYCSSVWTCPFQKDKPECQNIEGCSGRSYSCSSGGLHDGAWCHMDDGSTCDCGIDHLGRGVCTGVPESPPYEYYDGSQKCDADGGWYACGFLGCDLFRTCASNSGLGHCACPLPKKKPMMVEGPMVRQERTCRWLGACSHDPSCHHLTEEREQKTLHRPPGQPQKNCWAWQDEHWVQCCTKVTNPTSGTSKWLGFCGVPEKCSVPVRRELGSPDCNQVCPPRSHYVQLIMIANWNINPATNRYYASHYGDRPPGKAELGCSWSTNEVWIECKYD